MKCYLGAFASVGLLLGMLAGETALAQKPGGVLKMSQFDSPASMSLHEEATAAANRPMMGVFNNLVMYKQDAPQTRCSRSCPTSPSAGPIRREGITLQRASLALGNDIHAG